MLKKMVTAGTTLALFAGSMAVLTATPAAADPSTAAADPMATAIAAADLAVNAGYDSLTRATSDQYDRLGVYPWGNGTDLYSVAYQRSYHGLPVIGGDAVVLADGTGAVRQVNTATSVTIDVDTSSPAIKSDKAVSTSEKEQESTSKVESKRLVVRVSGDSQRLAWETVLRGTQKSGAPSRLTVWVDAQTGKVLGEQEAVSEGSGTGKWNGPSPLSIDTSQSGSTYYMKDTSRPGLQCSPYNGSVYSGPDDSWGNGNGTSTETGCVDAMYSAQQEWNMLRDWLGRTSHNGSGGSWPVSVGLNDQNAYWDGSSVTIGKNTAGNWISSMDVVGHEYGHGLDQFTPGGTSSEAGLGEATGDIFGALTEAYANQSATYDEPDYLVGEEINLVGTGPIRNMYNPSLVSNDPNCYSSAIPGTEVHAAAGPLNHWFYLMAEGSNPGGGKPTSPTCNSSTVTGVGVQTAGKIWFGGMMLKTSGMTYKKYRTATLTAAKNLDATCGLWTKTKAAWDAISVPAQTGDPTCTGGGQDFTMSLNPTSGTINAGQSGTSTVGTTAVGAAQTVNLTATVAGGTGVTATLNPSSVTTGGSSTLTISVAAGSTGSRTVTVTGTGSAAGTHSVTYNLTIGTVTNPDTPNVSVDNVKAHLAQLQSIATSNGGNRRAGSAGYTASVAYVKGKLQAAGYTVTEQNCTSCTYPSNNLIAEWPQGDANNVLMLGAHLDSVSAGPGINDNGSGSATLLEVALTLAAQNPTMNGRVRFAWWTDEESGLNGSEYYVNNLSSTERAKIKSYLNFDMVGSPNGGYFINNVNSAAATQLKAYWTSLNLAPEENTEGAGRSDDYSFQQAGIATSGYAAGASATKTSAQATKWGGTAGAAYDSCYHKSCDTTTNINTTGLDRSADGVAYAIWKTAVGSGNPGNPDFSIAVNPGSGTIGSTGGSLTTTVSTATVTAPAQTVNLTGTATGGITVSFSPSSVTSGGTSTATINVPSGTAANNYTVTITGTGTSGTHSTTYTVTVTPPGGGCTGGGNKIVNGGFESGTSPWTGQTGSIGNWSSYGQPAHSGTRTAYLDGYGYAGTDAIAQSVSVPAGCTTASLSFWIHIDTDETEAVDYDVMTVTVGGVAVKSFSNQDAASGYVQVTIPLGSYAGQTTSIKFSGVEDASLQTSFVLDDVTFTVG